MAHAISHLLFSLETVKSQVYADKPHTLDDLEHRSHVQYGQYHMDGQYLYVLVDLEGHIYRVIDNIPTCHAP